MKKKLIERLARDRIFMIMRYIESNYYYELKDIEEINKKLLDILKILENGE